MSSELVASVPERYPANGRKYKRLTAGDRAMALRYAKEGLTQAETAKRLGVTQAAISQWLTQCQDTRVEAAQYLDGQALPMAMDARRKGSSADLIKLLQGRGVVGEAQNGPHIIINIGGNDADVCIVTAQPATSYEKEHGSK